MESLLGGMQTQRARSVTTVYPPLRKTTRTSTKPSITTPGAAMSRRIFMKESTTHGGLVRAELIPTATSHNPPWNSRTTTATTCPVVAPMDALVTRTAASISLATASVALSDISRRRAAVASIIITTRSRTTTDRILK